MSAPRFLQSLSNPRSPIHIGAFSLAIGALTLISPRRRGPGGRLLLHLAEATVVGLTAAATMRKESLLRNEPLAQTGLIAGAMGLTLALGETGDRIDGRVEDALVRRGVKHPRPWLALAATALSALSFLEPRRSTTEEPESESFEGPELRELPTEVRDMIAAILDATTLFPVDALRAQLSDARESVWPDEEEPRQVYLGIEVPGDAPLASPRHMTLPIQAQFDVDGVAVCATLTIADGHLGSIMLDFVEEPTEGYEPFAGVTHWPALTDIRLVDESTLPA